MRRTMVEDILKPACSEHRNREAPHIRSVVWSKMSVMMEGYDTVYFGAF
jgi:hypothetical protein